jgi:two-component system NtrC family response regulator
VRELRNQIERILLLSSSPVIVASDFERGSLPPMVEVERKDSEVRLKLPPEGIALEALEREAIREALARSDGNVTNAARFLRVSRQTLMYRMRKYGFAKSGAG